MRISRLMMAGAAGAAALAACVPKPKPAAPVPVVVAATKADAWLQIVSSADLGRLQRISSAWVDGLAEARAGGGREAIAAEGDLLRPNAALARPAPTPGSYRCRLITLGRQGGTRGPRFEKYKPFFCYVEVEGQLFTIVKQTGSQRPAGRLWEDDVTRRLIFLGSLALGDEQEARAYGDDPKRDMAGVFERVGPFRWRLVIPFPQNGAKLDIFELTPVADQPES